MEQKVLREISTTTFWAKYWYYWLLFVLLSWVFMEVISIVDARLTKQKHFQTWTLSDTIRRWSYMHRWLAPVTFGLVAMLMYHFFIETNLV